MSVLQLWTKNSDSAEVATLEEQGIQPGQVLPEHVWNFARAGGGTPKAVMGQASCLQAAGLGDVQILEPTTLDLRTQEPS